MLYNGSPLSGSHPLCTHCHGPAKPPAGSPLTVATAPGNLQTAASAPAGLGLSGCYDRLLAQSQASAPSPPPQGQGVMGSPYHGTLWQWGVSTAKASRSWGSLVYPCAGHHPTLFQGTLALHIHPAFQQQDRALSPGLSYYHWLYQHISVWSLQGLACPTTTPVDMHLPGCPLLTD